MFPIRHAFFALSVLGLTACAGATSTPTTGNENLTSATAPSLANPSLESVRQKFAALAASESGGFYGYAAGFHWEPKQPLTTLTPAQKNFLGTELIQGFEDSRERIPDSVDFALNDIAPAGSSNELRLSAANTDLEAALAAASSGGALVLRYDPVEPAPNPRTAGALLLVDVAGREALILYGRRGPAPLQVDCTVTEMHAYEFEEALSKDEYPRVDFREVPLAGVSILGVGANGDLTSANSQLTVARDAGSLTVDAIRDGLFDARLVVNGTIGTVYGDRDGNGKPNKAATLACATH